MKQKKIMALLVCATMFVAVLAGCSKETEATPQEVTQPSIPEALPTGPAEDSGIEPHSYGIDYDTAFKAFAPDTVMIIVGDYTVTWAELFFYIHDNIDGMLQYGEIQNWSDILYEDVTYADIVLEYSIETAMMYKAVEYGAKLTGASLSEDVMEIIRERYESSIEQLGGEEEFLNTLWEMDGVSSLELYDYLVGIGPLVSAIFAEIYGENGELLSDEDVAAYTAYDGYLMAKHILRLKTDEEGDTALSDSEEILAQLEGYVGADFEAFFDELMWELSDDSGALEIFPNGYLFQYGDMDPAFYDACVDLEIGEFSGIVETVYGYHIIYRIPVNYDEIPSLYYQQYSYGAISYYEYKSMMLRNIAALGMFDSELYGWKDSLGIEYTAAYESMDFAKVFDVGEH